MPSPSPTPVLRLKRLLPLRAHSSARHSSVPQPDRRATLRDLYTSGLVSIFRRHSVLRVWEPLRETPRVVRPETEDATR